VEGFALTPAEQALFRALVARGVRFMIIGLGAALVEGAAVATQDIDLWFERAMDPEVANAVRDAGGFFVSAFGMQPPAFGGEGFERLDIVLTASGLRTFSEELEHANEREIDGISVRVLGLERVLASKRAAGRPKDLAAIPALEAALAARAARSL
jgi:predicted nucleotidyltransferase